MIIFILILIFILIIKNTNYVYDLSQNRTFNYFEIYDIDSLLLQLAECSDKIQIDDFLPEHIAINIFPDKGWGLVTKIAFKKDDIIYKCPLGRFPNKNIKVFSKEHGVKKIDKDVHLGDLDKKHNLFSYYNCFLNHDNTPTAYHETELIIDKGTIYLVLKASKNIRAGEELTIDYLYTNECVYYMSLFFKKFISFS